jgi:hypothetical protein
MWMSALAEHHQSTVHREKKEWGMELARLETALNYARMTAQFVQDQDSNSNGNNNNNSNSSGRPLLLDGLQQQVETILPNMELRLRQATSDNNAQHHAPVPAGIDLPEIPPQLTVNVNQAPEKLVPVLQQPLFANQADPAVKQHSESFQAAMDRLLFSALQAAEEKTESGKKALAMVNLPHALTAYRQKVSGGGIPDELWSRVQAVQHDGRIAVLQRELWNLRDAAEAARATYHRVEQQLEEDLEMDGLFRQQHVSFEGHDAGQVQNTFRQSLQNYDRLLAAARDGDTVLLKRLEILDTDPKYKLLQFQKSQLDRLLPGASGTGGGGAAEFDVSNLNRYLVELSTLFNEREIMLRTFKDKVQSFNIAAQLSSVTTTGPDAEREYQKIMNDARDMFHFREQEIQRNVNAQTNLIRTILDENRLFMLARDVSQASSSSDSCIVMIEDAIEEIEQLSKHLQEGSDFYKVIVPKLERLKQQVMDVSARLTIERCDYEDNTTRRHQERQDEDMARSFTNRNGSDHQHSNGDGHQHSNGARSGNARAPEPSRPPQPNRRPDQEGPRSGGSRDAYGRSGMDQEGPRSGGSRDAYGRPGMDQEGPRSGGARDAYERPGMDQERPRSGGARDAYGRPGTDQERPRSGARVAFDALMRPGQDQERSGGSPQPGVQAVSHSEPVVHVDDEKVASLVAMEFDPDKVVAALKKCDNNIDLALNELLSC